MHSSFQDKLGKCCAVAILFALLLWPLLELHAYYFEAPLYTVGDFAANELLVIEAKHFTLLHGRYSRVGFFHPGPFYLYALALGETLSVDLVPLLGSPLAAHSMTAALLASLALSLYFYVWFRYSNSILTALLATGVMMSWLTLAGINYLTVPWTPVMLATSMLFLLTGLMGWYLLNGRWILLALFGALQLLHGHASFLAFGLGGIALLYRPARASQSSSPASTALAHVSFAIFIGAGASLLLFVVKAIDETAHRYLLFWFVPAAALLSAAGIDHLLQMLSTAVKAVCSLALGVLLAYIASDSIPVTVYNFVEGPKIESFYQQMKQFSRDSGKQLRISLDGRQNQTILWSQTLAMLAKMKRDESMFACINVPSWDISFTEWARCPDVASVSLIPVTVAYISYIDPSPLKGDGELRLTIDPAAASGN